MAINKSILIVMENPAEAWTIGRDMINSGFTVTSTTSGKDGFNQMGKNKYGYLVVDSSIREVGLLNFLAYSRRYLPETKTIVICDPNKDITPATVQMAGASFCVPRSEYRAIISDIITIYNGG